MMYHCTRVSLSENLVQASYRQKCKFTPEAVCCCLQTCNFGFDMRVIYTVPVDQVLPPDKITQASYKLLMPEAVYKLVNVVMTLEWYCVPVYQVS